MPTWDSAAIKTVDSVAVVGVGVYWGIYRGFSTVHWGLESLDTDSEIEHRTLAVVGLKYRRRLDTFQGLENNEVAKYIRIGANGSSRANFMLKRIRHHPH